MIFELLVVELLAGEVMTMAGGIVSNIMESFTTLDIRPFLS